VLSVPVDTQIERDGNQYVNVSRAGVSERVEIETGISDDTYIEIKSGLTPDDLVIVPSEN
jgi:multidrug efflux pump subunit AcrA (membrane-fusion protein)